VGVLTEGSPRSRPPAGILAVSRNLPRGLPFRALLATRLRPSNNKQTCDLVMRMTASLASEKLFAIKLRTSKQIRRGVLRFDRPLPCNAVVDAPRTALCKHGVMQNGSRVRT
jgi:hypothetical protein